MAFQLLALPLAIKILLGVVATLGLGGVAYKVLSRKDKIVFLGGDIAAGKTTIIEVLKLKDGASLDSDDCEPSVNNNEDALEAKINGLKYAFIDTSGADYNKKKIEELKDKLKKDKDKVLEFYVFDASDFYDKNLMDEIKARKKEAGKRGFECVAIGTHKDKITSSQKEKIEKEVRTIMPCRIFRLTHNAKAKRELQDFISKVS